MQHAPAAANAHPLVDNAEPETGFEYDLVVVGGGSGGLAASKEAAKFGKKVAVLDFVKPTPIGTVWGLGGTCVNVGCIPKKLMHNAGLIGDTLSKDAKFFGWKFNQKPAFNWEDLVNNVQDYIGSLNFGYRTDLRSKNVEYINAYGVFTNPHEMELSFRDGKKKTISARRFIIATGGRPRYPGIPGDKEHCITSDDVFSLSSPPGKTLVVGASYVALECAGFLTSIGFDTTVMARSIFLRGFDQQIAEQIAEYMKEHGTKFIRPAVPTRIEKTAEGKKKVFYKGDDNMEHSDEYDTVLLAIGRNAETHGIGLDKAGVRVDKESGKIHAVNERTNVPHIYAIGDVLHSRPELTPVAIAAGKLLARRLYNGSTVQMDYDNVPTTVFTPLEYGAIGLPEEEAVRRFGAASIEVYHSYFKPLEWALSHEEDIVYREDNRCYAKLIVNKADHERVLGFHYLGPNAGEVTQGYGVAFKLGATKAHFDQTIGIHPTVSEEFTILRVTKSSGETAKKTGC